MQLIFLLAWAGVFCYQTNGKVPKHLKYSTFLTVQDAARECSHVGSYEWNKRCKEEKVWLVRPSQRVKEHEITRFSTTDIYECIDKCSETADCVRGTTDSTTCYIGKEGYSVEPHPSSWTSIELICCKVKQLSRQLSTNPNHNLPIVFNPTTDCEVGSVVDKCSPDQKVWILQENTRYFSSLEDFPYATSLECMNNCINKQDCYVAEAAWNNNRCSLNNKNGKRTESLEFNSYILKCCNVKLESLWEKRTRNLPILYDVKKMCISHDLFEGQECKIKIWRATEGVLFGNHYDESKNVDHSIVNLCLNKCSNTKKCLAVSVGPSFCYYYNKLNYTTMKYGYKMFINYQLTCCDIK